jgi:hypothetical protein
MKTGIDRPRVKKALSVATALTGVTAGAAFLPTTAAHASTPRGWTIRITMAARIKHASVTDTDVSGNYITEMASNPTGAKDKSVPFALNGVQYAFGGPQLLYLEYSDPGVSAHLVGCPIAPGSGIQTWRATPTTFSC